MDADAQVDSVLLLRSSAGLYGADRMVLALNEGLSQRGIRSRLLSINNYRLQRQPVHEHASGSAQDAVLLPCRSKLDMQTVAALVEQIDCRKATVLHVHDYKSAFYAWLAARRRPGVKLVATLHGWVEATQALRLYNRLEIALLRRFDRLVVVSQVQTTRLSRAGIPLSRIVQIDNGISISGTSPALGAALRAELGLDGRHPVFMAAGRLSPEKNLALLVDVFAAVAAALPGSRLLLAGDGPERERLQQQVRQLAMQDTVLFLGSRPDMQDLYPLVDCLVLPSLSEGMPLVVLEAMSHGVPVIASAVGDVPRLLGNTRSGKLVEAGDGPALRMAMIEMGLQPKCCDRKAEAYVRTHHSSPAMAGKYLALYQALRVDGHDRKVA
ncbi:MAG: glycosyltransferase family 4 protein [Pseudoxanthomonas sp.]